MKILFSTLGIIAAFVLGMLVQTFTHQRTVPTQDRVVTGTGAVASIKDAPASLSEKTATSTVPTKPAARDALFKGSLNATPAGAMLTYVSPLGFSFNYDSRLQTENTSIVLPGGDRVSALALVRYVPVQHCGLSGLPEHCRPYLENPALAFGVIGKSPKDVVSDHLDVFATYLESVTLNGITAAQYYAGVEGEGVVTILVPLKDKAQTLIVQYTYDTLFDADTSAANTLTAAEQKILVDSVLNTITIQ